MDINKLTPEQIGVDLPRPATRTSTSPPRPTRREEILQASAPLFASRGYRSVTLEQLGAAVGISGPAVYRHFPRKDAVLAELLSEVSEALLREAQERVAGTTDARTALEALVEFHVEFALANADLIVVQARELSFLAPDQQRKVRSLQRRYVAIWARAIAEYHEDFDESTALACAHAVFGLINSAPRGPVLDEEMRRRLLSAMARRALGLSSQEEGL